MARPTIEPITAATLPEFAAFLHQHLGFERSPQAWVDGFTNDWMIDAPNHGFVLRVDAEIVGGIGAIYASRQIDGATLRFCNITSWCVLDQYRRQSMRLAMALIEQEGYHFTDFSPTRVVGETLKFLKFRTLDERQVVGLEPALVAS